MTGYIKPTNLYRYVLLTEREITSLLTAGLDKRKLFLASSRILPLNVLIYNNSSHTMILEFIIYLLEVCMCVRLWLLI